MSLSLVSVNSIKQGISAQEQVKKYCNWRKRGVLRLLMTIPFENFEDLILLSP